MSKIKITILGTTAGVPTRERAHSAFHLSYDDGEEMCYLFDCGENAQRQMLIAGLNHMKIKGIFITHWHGDHCLGLPGLIDTMGFDGRKEPIDIYAPSAGRIKRALGFTYSMASFKIKAHNVPLKKHKATRVCEEERFEVLSIPVEHSVPAVAYALVEKSKYNIDRDKAGKLGLPESDQLYRNMKKYGKVRVGKKLVSIEDIATRQKGKRIVFSGDTEICDNLKNIASGADLLIQDCTYIDEKKPHAHASLPEIISMIEEKGVKRTILTHLSRKTKDIEEFKKYIKGREGIEVAEDFMEIVV